MKRKYINTYVGVMKEMSLSEEAKQRICKNCARYSTLHKIKNGRYVVTASTKEKTTDN
ncbi:MAG: hypothetical protein J6B25_09150 [Clostridia bacterium]|nr:hypothetical protein [Clostridia bacterium]